MLRERVEVEPERVRSGSLGGVPPQLAHQGEVDAGLDALHVGEDHGRDIQVGIEGGTDRIEHVFAVPELHGDGAGRRVRRRGFCLKLSIFFCVVLINACLRLSSSFFRILSIASAPGAMRAVFIAAFVSIAAVSATRPGEDIVVRPGPDTVHFGGYER